GPVAGTAQPTHVADHSLFGIVASAIEPATLSLAPPERKRGRTAGKEVVKVIPPEADSPYQPNPVQSVGYQYPRTRTWPASEETTVVKPAFHPQIESTSPASTQPNVLPATGQFPPANGMDVGHMLAMLRDSTQTDQRAWAAAELASVDGRGNPDVVDALVAA